METKRVEMNIPVALLELIDDYQNAEFLPNRTTAILELIRKGLKSETIIKSRGGNLDE